MEGVHKRHAHVMRLETELAGTVRIFNFYVSRVFAHCSLPLSPPPSTMLTTRGAVARLSKRAFKSAKQTNAFFSSAAIAQRAVLPQSTQQNRVSVSRSAPSTSGLFNFPSFILQDSQQ